MIKFSTMNIPKFNCFLFLLLLNCAALVLTQEEEKVHKLIDIAASNECKFHVKQICDRDKDDSNSKILNCLQRSKQVIQSLSNKCQHFLWTFKNKYMDLDYFHFISNDECKVEYRRFRNCLGHENHEDITCLLKHKNEVTSSICRHELNEAASIVFSDAVVVKKFIESCSGNIDEFQCGRLEVNQKQFSLENLVIRITSQAPTIDCLIEHIDKLAVPCKKELLRLGELQSDDYHLNPSLFLACRGDREVFCHSVEAGSGRIYKCLEKNKLHPKMTSACRAQLHNKQTLEARDYKVRNIFANKCDTDIKKYGCDKHIKDENNDLTNVILCLMEANRNTKLDTACLAEIMSARADIAKSPLNLDFDISTTCVNEIKEHCANDQKSEDDILHCLFRNSMPALEKRFSPECLQSMKKYVKVVDPTEDVAKLDPIIGQACSKEIETKCNIPKSQNPADLYECLLGLINEEKDHNEINVDCRENLLTLGYFVDQDYSTNHKLYDSCHSDIGTHCKLDNQNNNRNKIPIISHAIIHCLVKKWKSDFVNKMTILSPKCFDEVKVLMKLEASFLRLNFHIYSSCLSDVIKLCKSESYKMDCLQIHFQDLHTDCKVAITGFLSLDAEEYSLKKLIARSCRLSIRALCPKNKKGPKEDLMKCLVMHKHDKNMYKECRISIEHYQIISLTDIEINHNFIRHCSAEIKKYCNSHFKNSIVEFENASISKSVVLSCLSKKLTLDLLKNKQPFSYQCYEQMKFEYILSSSAFNMDPELTSACSHDIENRCSESDKDEYLGCLETYYDSLSEQCASLLLKRQILGALDSNFDIAIQVKCQKMIESYCLNKPSRKIFQCLHKNMRIGGFDEECREKLFNKLKRRMVDVRLNPRLLDHCRNEIKTLCNVPDMNKYISDMEVKEKYHIVDCLRNNYADHYKLLGSTCRRIVFEIIVEMNVDYRLDPDLSSNCKGEIRKMCQKEATDGSSQTSGLVQNCLKNSYLNNHINNQNCSREIVRLLKEGRADVHVDPQLYNACKNEISRICASEEFGAGRKLSCLLWAKDQKEVVPHMSQECLIVLEERKQMWEFAAKMEAPDNVKDVVRLVAESDSRYYIFMMVMVIIFILLLVGVFVGRCTKRPIIVRKRVFY